NLFAACTVAGIPVERIVRRLVPFVLVVLGCLMIITYVPTISLGLRDLVYAPAPAIGPAIGPAVGPQYAGPRPRRTRPAPWGRRAVSAGQRCALGAARRPMGSGATGRQRRRSVLRTDYPVLLASGSCGATHFARCARFVQTWRRKSDVRSALRAPTPRLRCSAPQRAIRRAAPTAPCEIGRAHV